MRRPLLRFLGSLSVALLAVTVLIPVVDAGAAGHALI